MSEMTTVKVPGGSGNGETRRDGFGEKSITRTGETASTALATQARAAVEARFVMALQRPRDIENFRVNILAACKRPLFAEDALYSKPVGRAKNEETGEWEEKFVEGLSIRFAEEALRLLGNAMTETVAIYDDQFKRIIRISATDLQTNVVHHKDITVEKTVERRTLKKGQTPMGTRLNSYGDTVYLVEATEDDLAKKEGALAAKAIRDKMLMLVPADIKEEARALVKQTQAKKDAEDPDAAKRKVIDAFAARGVMPDQLAEFLGHDLAAIQPAELQRLRAIYAAINDGEATWADIIEQKRDVQAEKTAEAKAAEPARAGSINDVAAQARARREGGGAGAKREPFPASDFTPPASKAKGQKPIQVEIVGGENPGTVELDRRPASEGPPPVREPGDDDEAPIS